MFLEYILYSMKNLKINTISTQQVGEHSKNFAVNPITGEIVIITNDSLNFLDTGRTLKIENSENVPVILFSIRNEQILALLADGRGFVWEEGSGEDVIEVSICDIFDPEKSSAEWSTDEQTLAVSDGKFLFLIDSSLTPFFERPLDFNESERRLAPVNVGWGSETTQFRGSAGKLKPGEKIDKEREEVEPHSMKSSVRWRFDGEFVGVSFFSEDVGTRLLTVFDKCGEVMSTMNLRNVYLSDCFAMRPNANLICASVLKKDASDDVVFFERNGETRNGYSMKWSKTEDLKRIKEISWNSSGTILAFHVTTQTTQFLEFWRLSNYEFTQKFIWKIDKNEQSLIWKWSSIDEAMVYVLELDKLIRLSIGEASSYSQELEMNFVVATDEVRISNLCKRAIPPPMCEKILQFDNDVVCLITTKNDLLHVLTVDNVVHQFAHISKSTNFEKIKSTSIEKVKPEGPIGGFSYNIEEDTYSVWTRNNVNGKVYDNNIGWVGGNGELATCDGTFWNAFTGEKLDGCIEDFRAIQVYHLNNQRVVLTSDASLFIGSTKIANTIVSILPRKENLMAIDFDNKLRFVDFENLKLSDDIRDVEAGCELVAADSISANVVLQASRGNLETIQPRKFVFHETKRLLNEKLYIEAFKWMKKHRIDMSFAMDHKEEELSSDVKIWLHNTSDSPLLEQLIVSCTEKHKEQGNRLCQVVYDEISNIENIKRKTKLFPLLLTSLLRSHPSKTNDSLKEIKDFSRVVEDRKDVFTRQSLHHVSFFVPAKELFNCALSTYDLRLAQQVAEASNYDPKEYLPVLNRLNKIECELERQYRINSVRENWPDCLKSLFILDSDERRGTEEQWWNDAKEIIERESLYKEALKIVAKNEKRYKNCCELYANQLEKRVLWKEAAIFYELAGNPEKTLKSWEMSRDVDGLVSAARRVKIDSSKLKIHAIKMSSALKESRQFKECAKALKLAGSPNTQIVQVLCDAQEWQLASREIENSYEDDEKSLDIMRATALSRLDTLKMDLERRRGEFDRYHIRLIKVRENKLKKLEQFAAGEIDDLRDDISMISSISSRSGSSKVSMASTVRRRKQIEKKKNSLKEGGEYEDSALLNVLAEIYNWISQVRNELIQLIPVLIIIGKIPESLDYQNLVDGFTEKLVKSKNSIWPESLAIQHLPGPLHALLDPTMEPSPLPMPPIFRLEPELIAPSTNFPVIFP